MAKNITGIAISINAFLPIGSTIDSQLEALTLVKEAHASGDYSNLLAAATVDKVKTEQKTRRVEEVPAMSEAELVEAIAALPTEPESELVQAFNAIEPVGEVDYAPEPSDAEVPQFLKSKAKARA